MNVLVHLQLPWIGCKESCFKGGSGTSKLYVSMKWQAQCNKYDGEERSLKWEKITNEDDEDGYDAIKGLVHKLIRTENVGKLYVGLWSTRLSSWGMATAETAVKTWLERHGTVCDLVEFTSSCANLPIMSIISSFHEGWNYPAITGMTLD